MLFDDSDIKIAGVNNSKSSDEERTDFTISINSDESIECAHKLGLMLSDSLCEAVKNSFSDDNDEPQMLIQKQILLAFTISVILDESCINDSLAGIAEKSFLDHLKDRSAEIYNNCNDTGAFSFYYLAYRRKTEIERRIGQTFAMLCAHDGDSIYQELGEAIYCWFASQVRKKVEEAGLLK